MGKKYSIIVSLFFSVILIAGCIGPEISLHPKSTEKIYNFPKKAVWKKVISVLIEMGANVQTMDKESGFLSTGEVGIPTETARKLVIIPTFHKVVMTIFMEANYQLNIFVSALDNKQTKVKITSRIRIKSEGWFVFKSNGTLESNFFAMLDNQLGVVKTKTSTQPTAIPPSPPPTTPKLKPTSSETSDVIYLITIKNSNIRAAPNTKSQILTTMKKGTKLEKIDESREWFKVKLPSGQIGHVYKPLVIEFQ